jgi:hypothetical protein
MQAKGLNQGHLSKKSTSSGGITRCEFTPLLFIFCFALDVSHLVVSNSSN